MDALKKSLKRKVVQREGEAELASVRGGKKRTSDDEKNADGEAPTSIDNDTAISQSIQPLWFSVSDRNRFAGR